MDLALVVLIAAALGGGVIGALVRAWSIHSRLYALEDRLLVVEGVSQREVKIRAATERWKKSDKDDALLTTLQTAAQLQPKLQLPWWRNPNLKQGGYP